MNMTELSLIAGACLAVLAYCGVSALFARRRHHAQYDRPRRWFDFG